jgi:hypothetical protein
VAQCRSLVRDGVHGEEWTLGRSRRSNKLEAVVVRLCVEEVVKRVMAALCTGLEKERGGRVRD